MIYSKLNIILENGKKQMTTIGEYNLFREYKKWCKLALSIIGIIVLFYSAGLGSGIAFEQFVPQNYNFMPPVCKYDGPLYVLLLLCPFFGSALFLAGVLIVAVIGHLICLVVVGLYHCVMFLYLGIKITLFPPDISGA